MDPVVKRLSKTVELADQLLEDYDDKKLMPEDELRYAISKKEDIAKRVAAQDNGLVWEPAEAWTHSMWWINTVTFIMDELKESDHPENYSEEEVSVWRSYYTKLVDKCKALDAIITKLS